MEVKQLFKPHQIQPEFQKTAIKTASPKDMFSAAEVEKQVAEALEQRERERTEEELGKFVEIRDAALKAAKEEISAAKKHAAQMEQAKQKLIEQLIAKDNELDHVRGLVEENQRLEQRIQDLEKSLEHATRDSWGNTFNKQAAKVVNKELEKTIEPLMSEVERLNNVLSQKEQELTRAKATSKKQQEELQQKTNSNSIITEFGEIGESLGWNGWSSKGYRAKNGMLYGGIHALTAFICDLKVSHPNYQEQEIPF
jgi:chromosome segregation ATPase